MAKSAQKLQARTLRKQGKSIGEIAKILCVAKSSVSLWCSDISLNNNQIAALLKKSFGNLKRGQLLAAESKRLERQQRVDQFQYEAIQDIGIINSRDVFMLGIGLYWAEGGKTHRRVRIVNSNPLLIRAVLLFLNQINPSTNLVFKCRLYINASHKDRYNEIQQYWQNHLGIPKEAFRKPMLVHAYNKKVFESRDTYFGVAHVDISRSTNLSYKVNGYINVVKYQIAQYLGQGSSAG